MRLLLTRPRSAAVQTAEKLRALGHDVLLLPMLDIRARPDGELPDGAVDALIITSRNALEVLAKHERFAPLRHKPLLVVGQQSARLAVELGLTAPVGVAGDVALLMAVITGEYRDKRLLYLRGAAITHDLAAEARRHRVTIDEQIVYEAVPAAAMGREIRLALGGGAIDGALFYSIRTATAFAGLIEKEGLATSLKMMSAYCLSPRIAACLPPDLFQEVRAAPFASETALLGLLPNQSQSSDVEAKREKP